MTTTTPLSDLLGQRSRMRKARSEMIDRHRNEINAHDHEAAVLDRDISLANAGLDHERVKRARSVIDVTGKMTYLNIGRVDEVTERRRVVDAAIADLASGHKVLSRGYFRVKSYSQWANQREDHDYGYGPKHGSIVFSVGLVGRGKAELSDEQIEDAVWLLYNLSAIEQADQA